MKLSDWKDKKSFEEAVLSLDNDEPLLILRKFDDGVGVVRGANGVLLHKVVAVEGLNGDTVEAGLISYTKRLLSHDFISIKERLGIKTPNVGDVYRNAFLQEAHEYTNYGSCEICSKEDGRTPHEVESMNKKELMICSSCKLKCLFVEAGGK